MPKNLRQSKQFKFAKKIAIPISILIIYSPISVPIETDFLSRRNSMCKKKFSGHQLSQALELNLTNDDTTDGEQKS